MPIFLVETVDGCIRQVVRAACKACARTVCATEAKAEGPAVWRDPEQSTVKLVEPLSPVRGIVLRVEKENV